MNYFSGTSIALNLGKGEFAPLFPPPNCAILPQFSILSRNFPKNRDCFPDRLASKLKNFFSVVSKGVGNGSDCIVVPPSSPFFSGERNSARLWKY